MNFFYGSNFSFCQNLLNALLNAPKVILFPLIFKSYFSMISGLFYLTYAILVMYLLIFKKIFIFSNSCFKFVKSCNISFVFCLQINAHAGHTVNKKFASCVIQICRSMCICCGSNLIFGLNFFKPV